MYFTRSLEEKFTSLELCFDTKFLNCKHEMENTMKKIFEEFKIEMKEVILAEITKQGEKIKILESDKAMLQKQIMELKSANVTSQSNVEELEQYGRRQCVRIDNVPIIQNETSNDVLQYILSICDEVQIPIKDEDIDRAHRIGKPYQDKISKKQCKSIIVKFLSFRKRRLFYRQKKKITQGKVKIDLTGTRHSLLVKANEYVEDLPHVKFCYADKLNGKMKILVILFFQLLKN